MVLASVASAVSGCPGWVHGPVAHRVDIGGLHDEDTGVPAGYEQMSRARSMVWGLCASIGRMLCRMLPTLLSCVTATKYFDERL